MEPDPKEKPRPLPLGNESTDPLAPAQAPWTLHEVLRSEENEEDQGGDPTPALDDPEGEEEDE